MEKSIQIEFIAHYGDEQKTVELSVALGGSGGYGVVINKYYHGVLYRRNGEWVGHLNDNSDITTTDVSILGEIIEKEEAKQKP